MESQIIKQELSELLKRTNDPKHKPKPEDIKALRQYLAEHTAIFQVINTATKACIDAILDNNYHTAATSEIMLCELNKLRRELGYNDSPPLEQMLIDQVLLDRLQLLDYYFRYIALNQSSISLTLAHFWDRRMTLAQARYLKACETLAKVRRLARHNPTLQVNITNPGGQAVNVAGDLVKKDS